MLTLLQKIGQKITIDQALELRIKEDFVKIETQKSEILLEANQRAKYLYYVEKGVLHNFYYHDGRQVSSWFYIEDMFITSWYSFYTQQPSFENIESLEDCTLYRISYEDYQKLIYDFPTFGNFARLLSEEILSILDQFSKSWSFLSAKEKYEILEEYFPKIEQRIKLGHIASFLGISQETLSRIRAGK
ncbi:Crp/Fnr family transcriptional regulator [Flammeovirga agarivorans]|uniref:Crp/Fnr family transcriptional regulator n=1 Tax=Flammeovirga agarivorans TaxID=2726742 RepID=A0A7X8SGG8_9BACT|nr:Crp/Fnr family transcriptional regulator [Flammeovirga agarivorans]NLR89805.1 Crp/Fnr family transcriptional regulator [Flammeovirga agarivorans]